MPRGAATDAPVLLDAYALIAHLRDEPAAGEVSKLLRRRACEISAVNLAEVLDQLLRVSRVSPARLEAALAPLLGEVIRVRSVEERDARRAAQLRAAHYDRRAREISLADCFLLAAARTDETIATADRPLAEVARSQGIEVVALVSSAGGRP